MNYIKQLDSEDYKLARKVERAGLASVSQAAKTIYRANEGDAIALKAVEKWEAELG